MPKLMDPEVEKVFQSYPEKYRKPLMELRGLILQAAKETPGVGKLEETLKWGQPSYVTKQSKSGSTVRIDRFGKDKIAIFFHCKTTLVDTFRTIFPGTFEFSKNRAIVFNPSEPLPEMALDMCIGMALTYHKNKRAAY